MVCHHGKPKPIPRVIGEETFPSEVISEGGAEVCSVKRSEPVSPRQGIKVGLPESEELRSMTPPIHRLAIAC